MSTIPKIDFLLLEMLRDGELVLPTITMHEKKEKYAGAIVLEPKVGLYKNVVVIDFASLYPSCYTTFNISPETIYSEEEFEKLSKNEKKKCYCLEHDDEVGGHLKFYINTKRKGILSTAVDHLLEERLKYKKLEKEEKNKKKKQEYDNIHQTFKILLNACYGVFGNRFFRLFKLMVAEAVTCAARMMLLSAFEYIDRNFKGANVIYGDTDSLFLIFEDSETIEDAKKKAQQICDDYNKWLRTHYINSINPFIKKKDILMRIEVDKTFQTFYLSTKKRYIGIDEKGNDSFKGIELVRSDFFAGLKPMLQKFVNKILVAKLTYNDLQGGLEELHEFEKDIVKLTVNKRFSKPLEEYDVETMAKKGADFSNKELGEEITSIDEPYMFYIYHDIEKLWNLKKIKTREDLDYYCDLKAVCLNEVDKIKDLDYMELDKHTLFDKMILEKLRSFNKVSYVNSLLDLFYEENIEPIYIMRKEMRARILRKIRIKQKEEKG